jgi:hypothetical protein
LRKRAFGLMCFVIVNNAADSLEFHSYPELDALQTPESQKQNWFIADGRL